jgi:hypothetical protein
MSIDPAAMLPEEAAEYLRISVRTLERIVSPTRAQFSRDGKPVVHLRHCHVGGQLRFRKSDLDRYLEQLSRASVPAPPPDPEERPRRSVERKKGSPLTLPPTQRMGNMRPLPIDLPSDYHEGDTIAAMDFEELRDAQYWEGVG